MTDCATCTWKKLSRRGAATSRGKWNFVRSYFHSPGMEIVLWGKVPSLCSIGWKKTPLAYPGLHWQNPKNLTHQNSWRKKRNLCKVVCWVWVAVSGVAMVLGVFVYQVCCCKSLYTYQLHPRCTHESPWVPISVAAKSKHRSFCTVCASKNLHFLSFLARMAASSSCFACPTFVFITACKIREAMGFPALAMNTPWGSKNKPQQYQQTTAKAVVRRNDVQTGCLDSLGGTRCGSLGRGFPAPPDRTSGNYGLVPARGFHPADCPVFRKLPTPNGAREAIDSRAVFGPASGSRPAGGHVWNGTVQTRPSTLL